MQYKNDKEVAKEIDKIFVMTGDGVGGRWLPQSPQEIKDFILSQRQQDREAIREWVLGKDLIAKTFKTPLLRLKARESITNNFMEKELLVDKVLKAVQDNLLSFLDGLEKGE